MFQQTLVLQLVSNTYQKYYLLITEIEDLLEKKKKKGFKKVVRKGKVRRKIFCPMGQRGDSKGRRCVIMKSKEKQKRRQSLRKSKAKRKGKMARIIRKRAKAMRKRKSLGFSGRK